MSRQSIHNRIKRIEMALIQCLKEQDYIVEYNTESVPFAFPPNGVDVEEYDDAINLSTLATDMERILP